ncbi:MAG: DNA/RNA non-specific endonuclease [Planctomycetaceae bacterium]
MLRLSEINSGLLNEIRQDDELMSEIESALHRAPEIFGVEERGLDKKTLRTSFTSFAETGFVQGDSDAAIMTEAIILRLGRPSFLIRNDKVEIPADQRVWSQRLNPGRLKIESAIKAVGRVELKGHASFPWVGTAWLVESDVIVTNRHVALEFARQSGREFVFRSGVNGQPMQVSIDFKEEYGVNADVTIDVDRILFIAPDRPGQPDMALLKLKKTVDQPPVTLADQSTPTGEFIAVIGYPARDDRRNDPDAARDIFKDIYEKKRLAPGKQQETLSTDPLILRHDCSTLGGNSGSVVVDVASGKAIGLHFGGRFEQSNFAVRVEAIRSNMSGTRRPSSLPPVTETSVSANSYANRPGYQPDFLGDDDLYVPLPTVDRLRTSDVLRQTAGPHRGSTELKYFHFSIVMSKSRKMPFFTAVNIDGSSLSRPHRERDVWRFDPRIPQSAQLGNELYQGNNLDRGHQVRRLDPVWGPDALLAQEDTFHYTNSCPQHALLNQGRTQWAGLEDYILDNVDRQNMKVSVFTGPVLNNSGVSYRQTLVPEEYWKIVANVDGGKLKASGYVLSQGQFLGDIEFAFGSYRTFQVSIRRIEEITGVSFGALRDSDVLGTTEGLDSIIELHALGQIVF